MYESDWHGVAVASRTTSCRRCRRRMMLCRVKTLVVATATKHIGARLWCTGGLKQAAAPVIRLTIVSTVVALNCLLHCYSYCPDSHYTLKSSFCLCCQGLLPSELNLMGPSKKNESTERSLCRRFSNMFLARRPAETQGTRGSPMALTPPRRENVPKPETPPRLLSP